MSENKIKLLLNGANGRMGNEVIKASKEFDNIEIVAGFDRNSNSDSGFPVFSNIEDINVDIDIILDFSMPEASMKILEFAKFRKLPIVIATTGFSEEQMKEIEIASKEIPVFKSANMSYEINFMAKLLAECARKLTDSDIEIVEVHHNNKVDSPSGTALLLADSMNEALNNEMKYEYDRHSKRQKRDKKEIGIHSIRGGTECGKHTVMFYGKNESFEISHNVTSRAVFANGALKATEFMIGKNSGKIYNMNDMF